MQYRKFYEWEISALGLGCMRLPALPGDRVDEEKAIELIRYAYDHGVNYFDTAYRYHEGESEIVTGKALSVYPRESFHLASKFPGHMLVKEPDGRLAFTGFPGKRVCFDSPKELFETQLQKCGVEYFDVYHLHNVNESSIDFYLDEEVGVIPYLISEKNAGRIRHLGFSSHGRPETIRRLLDRYPGVFDAVQIQINYMDWTLQDAKAKYELLEERGIPVISMESVRGGALARLPEKAAAVLKAADPDATQASWALRWLQAKPNVQIVLSGMSTLEQLKENLALFDEPKPLDEAGCAKLNEVLDTMLDLVPCTGCRYCTEGCPQQLEIPKLISMYNEAKNSGVFQLMSVMRGMKPEALPAACVKCGACRRVCPQGIDIPDILEKFDALLKAPPKFPGRP